MTVVTEVGVVIVMGGVPVTDDVVETVVILAVLLPDLVEPLTAGPVLVKVNATVIVGVAIGGTTAGLGVLVTVGGDILNDVGSLEYSLA